MLKILVICAAVAAACLLQTGCGLFPSAAKDPATAKPAVAAAAAPDGIPKGQHYDEPIIIDNPDAFIGLLPGDDHDFYLPPPVEPKDSPKSTALLVDHVKYTHVKLKGLKSKDTMEDTPYPLKTPLIKITFLDGTDKAGSMEVNWAELAGVGIVTMVSTDANAKKLRWKREKQVFSRQAAAVSSTTLFIAVVALVIPAVFSWSVFGELREHSKIIEQMSLWTSLVLIVVYLLSLVFAFGTHATKHEEPHPSARTLRCSRVSAEDERTGTIATRGGGGGRRAMGRE